MSKSVACGYVHLLTCRVSLNVIFYAKRAYCFDLSVRLSCCFLFLCSVSQIEDKKVLTDEYYYDEEDEYYYDDDNTVDDDYNDDYYDDAKRPKRDVGK